MNRTHIEHAHQEYHIGDPSKLAGYEELDIWRLKTDAQMGFGFPMVASVGLATSLSGFV